MDDPAVGAERLEALVARVEDPADELVAEGAVAQATSADLEAMLHGPADHDRSPDVDAAIVTGLAASPGTAVGVAVFDAWPALDVVDEGLAVILVRAETSPADEPAMSVVAGVLTSRGGMGSHAAVIARGRGLPAVCGAHDLDIGPDSFVTSAGMVVREGDPLVIDGSTGQVRRAQPAETAEREPRGGSAGARPVIAGGDHDLASRSAAASRILRWADRVRAGRPAVLANADTAADAQRALDFGAEGIGLCRTEHQFLAPDRLALLRQLILATSPDDEVDALGRLADAQQGDFIDLLAVMDGRPVTVRLLDPPLHEFLPDLVDLERADASGDLDRQGLEQLAAARRWHEHNPMLGVRGVRLAVLKPALYRMQVRALAQAAAERRRQGGDPRPRVMIPLVSAPEELVLARGWVAEEEARVAGDSAPPVRLAVGAMVETPRAALLAGSLAAHADFLSFGTNDLTQLTFGLSRDDAGRILEAYRDQGLLGADPFATLDADGVGVLLRLAVDAARAARPGIPLGVCGEHGGDPASIALFVAAGLDSVSCSPFRVPVARLAAAQSVMTMRGRAGGPGGDAPDGPPSSS